MIDYYRVADAINYINKNFKKQPSLEEVSEAVHLSPYHFQRIFKEWAGISPKKFLQFVSLQNAKELLINVRVVDTGERDRVAQVSGGNHDRFGRTGVVVDVGGSAGKAQAHCHVVGRDGREGGGHGRHAAIFGQRAADEA